jgi:chaperone required for assembly of F1-ATPase
MRELLDRIPSAEAVDPAESARRALRPQLPRRFYKRAGVENADDQFRLTLDSRPVRTPARNVLAVPVRALAEALAGEWEAQQEWINPAKMPLTRLANSIIDGVSAARSEVTGELERYLGSDLVFYRADHPQALVERQAAAWDPVLDWADRALGAGFMPGRGMIHVPQCPQAIAAVARAIPSDPWRLGAVHAITTLTGSALIALAVANGALAPASAWAAAHVDEDWNLELWGYDELALERRAARFAEMEAAASMLSLVGEPAFAAASESGEKERVHIKT